MSSVLLLEEKEEILRTVGRIQELVGTTDIGELQDKLPSRYESKLVINTLNRVFGSAGAVILNTLVRGDLKKVFGPGAKIIMRMLDTYASVETVKRVETNLAKASKKARCSDRRWSRVAEVLEKAEHQLEKLEL